jgi:hypothetical protein
VCHDCGQITLLPTWWSVCNWGETRAIWHRIREKWSNRANQQKSAVATCNSACQYQDMVEETGRTRANRRAIQKHAWRSDLMPIDLRRLALALQSKDRQHYQWDGQHIVGDQVQQKQGPIRHRMFHAALSWLKHHVGVRLFGTSNTKVRNHILPSRNRGGVVPIQSSVHLRTKVQLYYLLAYSKRIDWKRQDSSKRLCKFTADESNDSVTLTVILTESTPSSC